MAIQSETQLFAPIKTYLEQQGYTVQGEVRHCDIVAIKSDQEQHTSNEASATTVIVELKRTLSIPLLLQALDRLTISPNVYIAFERPAKSAPHRASWSELRKLCQALGIGMMTVRFYKRKQPEVYIECHPCTPLPPRPNKREATRVENEHTKRQTSLNIGGSTRRKVITAYREQCLMLAELLNEHGPSSTRELRLQSHIPHAAKLLQHNVYQWFERVERGVYRLTPRGVEALKQFAEATEQLREIRSRYIT